MCTCVAGVIDNDDAIVDPEDCFHRCIDPPPVLPASRRHELLTNLVMAIMSNRRTFLLLLIVMFGCNRWPTETMYPPSNVPADTKTIDPWIASLLDADVSSARRLVAQRLRTDDPQLWPLVNRMAEFVPYQVAFAGERGHLRCVRQFVAKETKESQYYALYLAQTPSKEMIQKRTCYFDESLRPTMAEFLSWFAGSVEEV